MAAVLAIPTTEKDRKQELTLKIRDHLDANPNTRNSVQFGRLTWRSANRSKTTSVIPTPPSGTPHGMAISHQQMASFVPLHHPYLRLDVPQAPFSVAGLPAAGHPVPSGYAQFIPPTSYFFHPSHIPPAGGQHNMYGLGPVPAAYQEHHPGA